MTHKEVVLRAKAWLEAKKHCAFTFTELVHREQETPDAIGWCGKYSFLAEAKVSRSDFLADKKKTYRTHPTKGMGNFRYYFCPPGLIKAEELPDKWGLVYVYPKQMRLIVDAKCIWSDDVKLVEHSILCSALRRVEFIHGLDTVLKAYSDGIKQLIADGTKVKRRSKTRRRRRRKRTWR